MEINNINKLNGINLRSTDVSMDKPQNKDNHVSFSTFLQDSLNKVNTLEKNSDEYNLKIATGQLENIHEAMIIAEKADIALQLTMQIRNKVLDAYKEIMRMQI